MEDGGRRVSQRRVQSDEIADFEDGRDTQVKECGKLEKAREQILLWDFQEGKWSCQHLFFFSPVRSMSDIRLLK